MRKQSFGLLFSAMLISVCFGFSAKNMTVEAQEAVLNEANIVENPVATVPVPEMKYTFTDMTAVMYAQNTVNVRNLPSTDGKKLGRFSVNDEIIVNGQCNETGWYRFDYNGSVAYVSNKYVSANRVEIQASANNSGSGTGSVASNWADSYPKNQWIDMGSYFFYIANSQPEANRVCCDYTSSHITGDDAHVYHTDLNARYPDRRVCTFSNNADGVPIAVVCSEYETETNLYRPKFLWETTKLSARVIYVD